MSSWTSIMVDCLYKLRRKLRWFAARAILALVVICSTLSLVVSIYITTYYEAIKSHQHIKLDSIFNNLIKITSRWENDSRGRRLTDSEVAQRFQSRLQRCNQACKKYYNSPLFHPLPNSPRIASVGAYWPVMNVSARYCTIEKTGSDTWYEHFRSIRRKMASLNIGQTQNVSNVKQVTFLFVRDPYQRLLSAYVDKLLSPNTIFWVLGKYIVRKFRPNPSNISLTCGHDVTFPEFIQYVIDSQETGYFRDGHFVPAHDHCGLCNVSYDYIGHLETMSEDMPYLLNVMQSPVNYTINFDKHTLLDNAEWVLNRMTPKIRTCMSMKEACVRLWKKWHIRGILSKAEPLPVTSEEAEVISSKEFFSRALQALARSGPKSGRSLQKAEAMREAFGAVPLEHRQKLRELLFLDFELFGFDPSPETVFPNVTAQPGDASTYRYFDLQT